jgi:predicted transcriptional regulator
MNEINQHNLGLRSSHGNRSMLSPQALTVLNHLEAAGSITNVDAHVVLKVRSVSRRITELTDAGYVINKEWKRDTTGQRYVKYHLV